MIAKLLAAGMLPGVWTCDGPPAFCVAGSRAAHSWFVAAPGRATQIHATLIWGHARRRGRSASRTSSST